MDPMGTASATTFATEMHHWLADVFPHSWAGVARWSEHHDHLTSNRLDFVFGGFLKIPVYAPTLHSTSMLSKIGLNMTSDKKILIDPDFSYTLKEQC
jgi:hypothetical protein